MPWVVAHQAPLPMGLSRQEHWSELPLPFPFTLLTQEILAPWNFACWLNTTRIPRYFLKKIYVPLFAFFLCACPGKLSAFELTKGFRHWGVNEVPGDVWKSGLRGFSWSGWATIWIWFYKEVSPLRTWWFSFSCLNNTAWRMAPWWDKRVKKALCWFPDGSAWFYLMTQHPCCWQDCISLCLFDFSYTTYDDVN